MKVSGYDFAADPESRIPPFSRGLAHSPRDFEKLQKNSSGPSLKFSDSPLFTVKPETKPKNKNAHIVETELFKLRSFVDKEDGVL